MTRLRMIVAGAAAFAVSGCSSLANLGSVYREADVNSGATLILDAEQNALVNISRGDSQIICSQPSPDATAADSLSAGLGASNGTDQSAQAAFAMGQTVGSLSVRTQSIQLLRDAFFRLCEAYQNGGVDDIEYGVNLRRLENTMIAILAVEQLTGAVVSGSTSNVSNGSSTTGENAPSATTTGSGTSSAPTRTGLASADVTDAVQTITMAAIAQDDSLDYCLDFMRFNRLQRGTPLYAYCVGIVEHDLHRVQQRGVTAQRVMDELLANPDMSDSHRQALLTVLSNIAADGEFRGLSELLLPEGD